MISFNAQAIVDWLSKLGLSGMVLLALVGFYQGWWVFGRELATLKALAGDLGKDRDEWKARYLASIQIGERAVITASHVVANGEQMVTSP
jgi:hypothetical protein